MLRPIHVGMHRPISYPLDPDATFQPGMVGQLHLVGNEIVMGVSNGIAPFGLIDDARDIAFTQPVIDEIQIVVATSITSDGYQPVMGADVMKLLDNSNILEQSWRSDIRGVTLTAVNGAITVPAGTPLNYKSNPASPTNDSVLVKVNYSYYVPNKPGTDTTLGSGMVSIWIGRGLLFSTDQYDTSVPYGLNSPLYVSPAGKLTSEQSLQDQPAVGMVTVPPTSVNNMMEFLWG
jgi:hypothetical protein